MNLQFARFRELVERELLIRTTISLTDFFYETVGARVVFWRTVLVVFVEDEVTIEELLSLLHLAFKIFLDVRGLPNDVRGKDEDEVTFCTCDSR